MKTKTKFIAIAGAFLVSAMFASQANADIADIEQSAGMIAEYAGTVPEGTYNTAYDAPFTNENTESYPVNDEPELLHIEISPYVYKYEMMWEKAGYPATNKEEFIENAKTTTVEEFLAMRWSFDMGDDYIHLKEGSTMYVQLPDWLDWSDVVINDRVDTSTGWKMQTYRTESNEFGIKFLEDVVAFHWRGYLFADRGTKDLITPPDWEIPSTVVPLWPTMPPVSPEPEPETTPDPIPDPTPDPEPETTPEPEPTPEPTPELELTPDPEPAPVLNPAYLTISQVDEIAVPETPLAADVNTGVKKDVLPSTGDTHHVGLAAIGASAILLSAGLLSKLKLSKEKK